MLVKHVARSFLGCRCLSLVKYVASSFLGCVLVPGEVNGVFFLGVRACCW